MMKKFSSIIFALFLILFVFGCTENNINENKASILIQLPGNASRQAYSQEDIASYTISLYGEKGFEDSKENLLPGSQCKFLDLEEDTYHLDVYAFNSDEEVIGEGSEAVEVTAGNTAKVKITIYLAEDHTNEEGILVSVVKLNPDFKIVSSDIENGSTIILSDSECTFAPVTLKESEAFADFTNFVWTLNGSEVGTTGLDEDFILNLYTVDAELDISGENILSCMSVNNGYYNSAVLNFTIKSDCTLTFKNSGDSYFDRSSKYYDSFADCVITPAIIGSEFPLSNISQIISSNSQLCNIIVGWKDSKGNTYAPDGKVLVCEDESFEPVWNLFEDEIDVQQAKNGTITLFSGSYYMEPHTINGHVTIRAEKENEVYIYCYRSTTEKGGVFQVYNDGNECSLTLNNMTDCGNLYIVMSNDGEKSAGAILNVQEGATCSVNKGVVLKGCPTLAKEGASGINIQNGTVYLRDMSIEDCAAFSENVGVICQNGNLYLEGKLKIDAIDNNNFDVPYILVYNPVTLSGPVSSEKEIYLTVPEIQEGMKVIDFGEYGNPECFVLYNSDYSISDEGVVVLY